MRIEFIYKIVGMVKKFEWYPGDDRKKHFQRIKKTIRKKTKLRKGLDAGTICILLSGRFKGKRVVFLKQLDSGLLLVTGPYKINGVPLRRVNQAYVIPTSTVVEVPQMPDMQDSYFAKEKKGKSSQEEKFFAQDAAVKKEFPVEKKKIQTEIDSKIIGKLDVNMKKYLKARFSLRSGMKPHEMNF